MTHQDSAQNKNNLSAEERIDIIEEALQIHLNILNQLISVVSEKMINQELDEPEDDTGPPKDPETVTCSIDVLGMVGDEKYWHQVWYDYYEERWMMFNQDGVAIDVEVSDWTYLP